jgi:anti-sigma factor RsiW
MIDCGNVEMRELLPEHMHGVLDVAARARVDAHLAGCEPCRAELALLRQARAVLGRAPRVDAERIARALPAPGRARPQSGTAGVGRRSPTLWRIAATIAVFAVGGTSVFVASRLGEQPAGASVVATGETASARTVRGAQPAGLSFGGGFADLSDAELEQLLGTIEEAAVLPGVEPEPLSPPLASEEES